MIQQQPIHPSPNGYQHNTQQFLPYPPAFQPQAYSGLSMTEPQWSGTNTFGQMPDHGHQYAIPNLQPPGQSLSLGSATSGEIIAPPSTSSTMLQY
jgi:hypothetical protein